MKIETTEKKNHSLASRACVKFSCLCSTLALSQGTWRAGLNPWPKLG